MRAANPHVPQVQFASDHSLLVSFGNELSLEIHHRVVELTRLLIDAHRDEVLNVHPAYCTVLISFDPRKTSPSDLKTFILRKLEQTKSVTPRISRSVEIPVCYGDDFGPDLRAVAEHNNLSTDEVIQIHSSDSYLVYFLGFSPGFPYLGGMSERIETPRLLSPRKHVPAGSVAIGGSQTGIYPVTSPGGWRLIGRTPVQLFNPERNPPTYLQMGDSVRFKPITRTEFDRYTLDR